MGYGGAVWHCSVSGPERLKAKCHLWALTFLEGAGDAKRGEWQHWTGFAYHIRRRLSVDEEKLIGAACDVRGTIEAQTRYEAIKNVLPQKARLLAMEELAEKAR